MTNEYRALSRKQLRKQANSVLREIRFNNEWGFTPLNPLLYAQLEKISQALEAKPKSFWALFKEGMAD